MNEKLHVYCPKCGSEVMLADENGKAITPKSGDFFLRLKDNDQEKAKKLKDVIAAMMGDDVEIKDVAPAGKNNEDELEESVMEDEIEQSIMEDGDINSKFLWRRWIMSQVLRHYKTSAGKENFHNYFVKEMTMNYMFKTCINEAKALSRLTGIDKVEREQFFNMNVFETVIHDYLDEYSSEIEKKLVELDKINREIVYEKGFDARRRTTFKIGRKTIYVVDIARLKDKIKDYRNQAGRCGSYQEMASLLKNIVKTLPPFKGCHKSKAWIDAFKGAGAFYTLDNLLRWHNCTITTDNVNHVTYSGDKALKYLREKTGSLPANEYYKLYAIMKRVVEENNFDFNKRMNEIRNNGVA